MKRIKTTGGMLSLEAPSEKQRLFLTDTHKYVAYGGARGGGKSWAVRAKAMLLCLNYAGIKTLIVRSTYPELYNNHIAPLRASLAGIAQYNDAHKMFTFPNSSTIKFGYCNNDGDVQQYQGAEYDVIFIDEATNLEEDWIKKIIACMRGVNDFPKRIYYTCNPGGRSHHYIKRLFIDRNFERGEDPDEYSFIQAKVGDNPALLRAQPDYVKQLESLPPQIRAAWLDGSWDINSGQFFSEFRNDPEHYADREWTHVIDPLPDSRIRRMTLYRSYDFGYHKPFSLAWWGVDSDGILYRLLEFYGCNGFPNEGIRMSADEQFRKVREIEDEHPWLKGKHIHGVADPAIWNAESGESVAETAARYGIYFDPGDNARIAGWMQMRYRMQFDENGRARMYFFKDCKAIIRTLPLLQFDERKVEDLDTSGEDHAADEARYLCMARPVRPLIEHADAPPIYDPLGTLNTKKARKFNL